MQGDSHRRDRAEAATDRVTHEEAFVRAFIIPQKRARYLSQLASAKRRSLFLERLNHSLDYDPALAERVPSNHQDAATIEVMLRRRGAPDVCHVISSLHEWDGREMPLRAALDLIIGNCIGTVVSCVPGRLAYYESEDVGERYLLEK
jgi:hypothetical protein